MFGRNKTSGEASFDPEPLERAAKAAKELDGSRNASGALELVKSQEKTKQLHERTLQEEHKANTERYRIQAAQVETEERRKQVGFETEQHKERAQYADQLARRRAQEQMQAQRELNEENIRRQEEEARRRMAYQAELEQRKQAAKMSAKYDGKIKLQRENHDLLMEEMKLKSKEERETTLEKLKATGNLIQEGIDDFLNDSDKIMGMITMMGGIALAGYSAKTGTGIAGRYIESYIGKPSLIRETSRKKGVIGHLRQLFTSNQGDALSGIVLKPNLESRLRTIATSTTNTRKHQADYRNLLLWGPPGTGKTMFARQLANASGMDYAVMTGGDVAPLGAHGVTELHKMFDWATKSRKGLLIFVDEAEAFLRSRQSPDMTENVRNALNGFLFRTGEASKKVMVVLSTNHPELLDRAVVDRVGEYVEFEMPGQAEREHLVRLYFHKYIGFNSKGSKFPIETEENVDDSYLMTIASRTEGFSGRQISALMLGFQASVYGSASNKLTLEMCEEGLAVAQDQHRKMGKMHSAKP